METEAMRRQIEANAREVARLHARVHETFGSRDRSAADHRAWVMAAQEFRSRYEGLAFPGGFDEGRLRILAGDPEAMEAAVCFLELRPYFFRSGYMYDDLMRRCRRAPLSEEQRARYRAVKERHVLWRLQRRSSRG